MRCIFITVRNTHFNVEITDNRYKYLIRNMISTLMSKKMIYDPFTRRNRFVDDKAFYRVEKDKYTFNIGLIKKFMLSVRDSGIEKELLSVQYDKHFPVEPLEIELLDGYEPRPYQLLYINELIKETSPSTMLVDLQTGRGKGYLTTYALTKLNMKTMFLLLPKYIDKWILELQDYVDIDRDDIFVIRGRSSLLELMSMKYTDYKFIIFSVTSMNNYIRDAVKDPELYPVQPDNLMQHLKVGVTVNDEAHQHYHAVYNALLYFNSVRHIGLSATLVSNDRTMTSLYNTMYPPISRISNLVKYNKYIIAKAVKYRLANVQGIQFKRAQGYSHNLYEQSIMRNSILLKEYIGMIYHYLDEEYVNRKNEDEKCLIFVASIRLATVLSNFIKNKYKDLLVRRYVEDDPYANVITSDICITTYGSAGVGLDIPKLITVLDTTSVGSQQSNIQAAGRLREIKGVDVKYTYLYTDDITNQRNLHKLRYEALKDKVKEYSYDVYDYTLQVK